MAYKFFYLYLAGGILALIWFIYKLMFLTSPVNFGVVVLYLIPVIILFYLAYKVYHEKKDSEIM
ncbi:hypothetical protein KHS38_00340 [Mucilaginibacter sp. Bleaf8]|uniref:hypothetical protein n=1 Tax=Mucilaginibacter sp. Bleaf8 TaxID=2834430 RepID=UPI001BD017D9|nr:hypothetical protein [Mucilaginibacter sp. Bleaf8]MBS7562838.1 hypothetical protein [Mucilaginibacter sp. Bleaf8]